MSRLARSSAIAADPAPTRLAPVPATGMSKMLFNFTRLSALAAALLAFAAAGPAQAHVAKHYPYTLIDLGTFGGPQADVGNGPYINAGAVVTGTADTTVADPYGTNENGAFNGDPFVQHAYIFRNGVLTDLGALGPNPANNSSYPNGINAQGGAAGLSDNGAIDPLTGTAETDAVLWKNGQIINLGTLGGNQSGASSVNSRDQVVGAAANATQDPFSMLGWGTQSRAFLWQNGHMHDLGTLGGPDSFAWFINDAGTVTGVSYTSATPNPVTGQPPTDAFIWMHGKMRDLGSLGGSVPTFGGVTALNRRGEVVGQSGLAGDQIAHPFLWNGQRMIDLGTLGGANGGATSINERGAVDGTADLANETHHAFLWIDGRMHDLQPLSGRQCSNGEGPVNDQDVVAGNSTDCHGNGTATLWRNGSPVDLNSLAAPSSLYLTDAEGINDAGDIIGEARLPDGSMHNFLLMPSAR